jgi:hypothetical protein
LEFQDGYGHLTKPNQNLKPELEARFVLFSAFILLGLAELPTILSNHKYSSLFAVEIAYWITMSFSAELLP